MNYQDLQFDRIKWFFPFLRITDNHVFMLELRRRNSQVPTLKYDNLSLFNNL